MKKSVLTAVACLTALLIWTPLARAAGDSRSWNPKWTPFLDAAIVRTGLDQVIPKELKDCDDGTADTIRMWRELFIGLAFVESAYDPHVAEPPSHGLFQLGKDVRGLKGYCFTSSKGSRDPGRKGKTASIYNPVDNINCAVEKMAGLMTFRDPGLIEVGYYRKNRISAAKTVPSLRKHAMAWGPFINAYDRKNKGGGRIVAKVKNYVCIDQRQFSAFPWQSWLESGSTRAPKLIPDTSTSQASTNKPMR